MWHTDAGKTGYAAFWSVLEPSIGDVLTCLERTKRLSPAAQRWGGVLIVSKI